MTRIALLQMCADIDPQANASTLADAAQRAAGEGADMLFTPEMSNFLDRDRKRAAQTICHEDDDPVLSSMRDMAARHGIWIALGSLALKRDDGSWANRSIVIDNSGSIAARYDKIHMFDVELDNGESWKESAAYKAGREVAIADVPLGKLGLSICYDIRFPALFEELGQRGCDAIAIPAAFTVPTGKAHWHILQRARAIEATSYVISAAQCGQHPDGRSTYGHSLVVDPWGEIVLDLGDSGPELGFAEIDPKRIETVRRQLPSLANRRSISKPAPS
ncbi:carbon-nitrogen hydrolase family protein [Altericroceibacterium endophyticum]|uniref:Carbon-nitrogen hydrolase family protein n=1 Tax=Altericroceibacterium endophyticum TaxID=1808508 RepID=A0A6I4T5K7_9SPHN|nr:carbon-nitrogen hydrolase family protein [Altericroceibacterium endophyticum]MXO65968.1 carbon-nitrogen hydrolase family protein [Altericroceibacterium endophyticum]